ncbi:MAG: hypothetical protein ACOVQE_07490 [Chitinophagaceae bacterium]
MKNKYSFLVLSLLFLSACSTVYKTSQTPDDLYYSPGETKYASDDRYRNNGEEQYAYQRRNTDDRYLRMKVTNPQLWSGLDDFRYWNDARFQMNMLQYQYPLYIFNNPWNMWTNQWYQPSFWGWNSWFHPAYCVIAYKNPKLYSGSTSGSQLVAYQNRQFNNGNIGFYNPKTGGNTYMNTNTRSNTASSQSSLIPRPTRTFSSSQTPSSNAGGRSGGFNSSGSSSSGASRPRSPR